MKITDGNMGVTFGGPEAGVAEKVLDIADVRTVFKKMRGEGVAQPVNRGFLNDAGA
jgi:hypothetical protein